jgi:hypothetical protein
MQRALLGLSKVPEDPSLSLRQKEVVGEVLAPASTGALR